MIFEPFAPFLASEFQVKFANAALGAQWRLCASPRCLLPGAGALRRKMTEMRSMIARSPIVAISAAWGGG